MVPKLTPSEMLALDSSTREIPMFLSYSPDKIFCVPKACAVRIVDMTSSARLPASATCFKDNLVSKKRSEFQAKLDSKCTHSAYLDSNLFRQAPMIAVHGMMGDKARARRHDRAKARIKPTKNALMKVTAWG